MPAAAAAVAAAGRRRRGDPRLIMPGLAECLAASAVANIQVDALYNEIRTDLGDFLKSRDLQSRNTRYLSRRKHPAKTGPQNLLHFRGLKPGDGAGSGDEEVSVDVINVVTNSAI
ncbi:unnamed protein product [Notodromas monacha]|uniref:Uncharacterized protein n=1 Tax=Notodromas monacha TaxID=399045 RepID=A0A7R9G835_9CRUS|nr:unnamed protein product [Notodromas monacha]CAG0912711.1 unnamed protein product [Notodromas monacha]